MIGNRWRDPDFELEAGPQVSTDCALGVPTCAFIPIKAAAHTKPPAPRLEDYLASRPDTPVVAEPDLNAGHIPGFAKSPDLSQRSPKLSSASLPKQLSHQKYKELKTCKSPGGPQACEVSSTTCWPSCPVSPHWFRILLFFLLSLLFLLVLVIIHICYAPLDISHIYLQDRLTVVVLGCDVDIISGPKAELRLTGISLYIRTKFLYNEVGNGAPYYLSVVNPRGCDGISYLQCRTVCLVTISVPPNGSSTLFHVYQDPKDQAPVVRVNIQDVLLPQLHIVGSSNLMLKTAGPSIEVFMQNVMVERDLWISTTGGGIYARQLEVYGTVSLQSDKNHLWVVGLRNESSFDVRYRAVENGGWFVSHAGHQVVGDPDGPWSLCAAVWMWQKTYSLYDLNGDGFIDKQELLAGISSIGGVCCGERCPFVSLCDPLTWKIFPQDPTLNTGVLAGRANILTSSGFKDSLQALNLTYLMPKCQRLIRFLSPNNSRAVGVPITVNALAGQVLLVVDPLLPVVSQTLSLPDGLSPPPVPSIPKLVLLQADAARLQKEVGVKYGALSSTMDAFVTIDVVPAPGVPPGRWVYATRPVYLALPPPYIFLFSVGILSPPVIHYRVHFGFANLTEDYTVVSQEDSLQYPDRLVAIHAQLQQALRGDAYDSVNPLRGPLVYLNGDRMYSFLEDPVSLVSVMDELHWDNVAGMLTVALCLDALLGFFAAGLVFRLFLNYACWELARLRCKKNALWALYKMRFSKPSHDKDENKPEASHVDPFGDPVEMVDRLVGWPLLHKRRNLLADFIKAQCEMVNLSQERPQGSLQKVCTFAKFMEKYENFCLQRDTEPKTSAEVRQQLTKHYRVRVFEATIYRLVKVRWRKAEDDEVKAPEGLTNTLFEQFFCKYCVQTDSLLDFIDVDAPFKEHEPESEVGQSQKPAPTGQFLPLLVSKFLKSNPPVLNNNLENQVAPNRQLNPEGISQENPALLPVFKAYCIQQGTEGDIQVTVAHLLEELDSIGIKVHEASYWRIWGLGFKCDAKQNDKASAHIHSSQYYLFEVIAVLLHILFLLFPSFVVLVYTMQSQNIYAHTIATAPALQWIQLCSLQPGGERMLLLDIIFSFELVVIVLATLRMLLSYLGCTAIGHYRTVSKYIWGLHCFLFIGAISSIAGWVILSAILFPSKLLPCASAIIVVIAVVIMKYKQLHTKAYAFATSVSQDLHQRLQEDLRAIKDAMREEDAHHTKPTTKESKANFTNATGAIAGDAADGSSSSSNAVVCSEPASAPMPAEVSAGDLFAILDKNKDGVLPPSEFEKVFQHFPICLNHRQVEQLFAFLDADGNSEITRDEFQNGWDTCLDWIVEQTIESAGLSSSHIVFICLTIGVGLVVLFCFIFIAAALWLNESNFNAVVQSLLLAGSGKAATLVNSNPPDPKKALKDALSTV